MRNLYFSDAVRTEQDLYENIVIESLKMFGQDVYYIPRDIVSEDRIFGDDIPSRFNSSYKVEMYIENVEGFDGEGDLFTKFGVEIRDQATFVVARKRWTDTVLRYDNEISGERPREGDLVYLPLSRSLFQIMQVEHEQPFYQLSNLAVYKLRCELFEYSSEDFDTGVLEIDDIQKLYDYLYRIQFTQTQGVGTPVLTGNTLSSITLTNGGKGYTTAPTVTLSNTPAFAPEFRFGNNALQPTAPDAFTLDEKVGTYSTESYRGTIDFFVYINNFPESGEYAALLTTGLETSDEGRNYRNTYGINSDGQIVRMSHESGSSVTVLENIIGANRLTTDTWHHIRLSTRGNETGEEVRTFQVHIDGIIAYRVASVEFGAQIYDQYQIGTDLTVNSVLFDNLDGYIDDFFADINIPVFADSITVPAAARTGEETNAVAYENFDTSVTISVTMNDDVISAISVDAAHDYFRVAPTVVVPAPEIPNFEIGNFAQQTLSTGVTITGEIVAWDPVNLNLDVVDVETSDGEVHAFVTNRFVIDTTNNVGTIPTAITEANQLSANEQNDDFSTISDDFLDFTETNPFGDPS